MDILITKIFFMIAITLYLIGIIIPIILIKRDGKDPHGTHQGSSFLTRLSSFMIFAWLFYIILYLIIGKNVLYFWVINLLINDFINITGIIISSFSFIIEFLGLIQLGKNFRIEFPREETDLVTSGIYKITRNPILLGMYLLLIGSFFILPTFISLILFFANLITFNSKAIDEEKYLLQRFGQKFEEYKSKVGRYLPFKFRKKEFKK